mgnify:CR=1 FL=1
MQRLREDGAKTPLWTTNNIILFMLVLSTGLFVFFAGILASKANLTLPGLPTQNFPTTYPLKDNEKDCEESGRIWRDGECYDYDHDPTF